MTVLKRIILPIKKATRCLRKKCDRTRKTYRIIYYLLNHSSNYYDILSEFYVKPGDYIEILDMPSSSDIDSRSASLCNRIIGLFSYSERTDTSKPDYYYYPHFLLLLSIIEYLYFEAPADEQNVYMIVELLAAVNVETGESDLDLLFNYLIEKNDNNPEKHIATYHYKKFKTESHGHEKSIATEIMLMMRPVISSYDDVFQIAGTTIAEEASIIHFCMIYNLLYKINNTEAKRKHNSYSKNLIYSLRHSYELLQSLFLLIDILSKMKLEKSPKVTMLGIINKMKELSDSTDGKALLMKIMHFFSSSDCTSES